MSNIRKKSGIAVMITGPGGPATAWNSVVKKLHINFVGVQIKITHQLLAIIVIDYISLK